jgi:cellobiose phosphorylase
MAGVGHEDGKAAKSLESVNKYLSCKYGLVLNNPPFTKYYLNLGEITTYPPGYKENAGIFCHNNPWIIISEAMLGNNERAWEYYKKIAPAYLEEISEIHKTEPYVYSQMIAGKDAQKPGEAKNSWLTGTAAWNFYAVSQYLLGIRPDYEGLRIDPKLPESIGNLSITRKFRGAVYHININNNSSDKIRITLEGNDLPGNLLPLPEAGREYNVDVFV